MDSDITLPRTFHSHKDHREHKAQTLFSLCSLWLTLFFVPGCFDLDDNLFNATKLSSYNLPTTVIPETSRTAVTLTSQGKRIYGYFVRGAGAMSSTTILYCHGNKDHLQYYWDRVEFLYQAGFSVFIFDYQGFGMSEGEASEEALVADGRAALAYVLSRPDVDTSRIVFYGFSLGNVVSIDLAANVRRPRVLISEAPFASAQALVQSGSLLDIPPSYVMQGEYRNDEKIKRVTAPFLLMHGVNDTFIDIDKNGAVIYANARDPKQFVRVEGANHSDVPQVMGVTNYQNAVRTFVQAH